MTVPTDRPTRADYVAWRTVTTRWGDDDVYGHMNNARYYELFDTAVNAHLTRPPAPTSGRCRRSASSPRPPAATSAQLGFPEPVETGLVVEQGRHLQSWSTGSGCSRATSDEAAAEGRFVHVYVDNTDPSRPVTPLPEPIRAAVTPLLRADE